MMPQTMPCHPFVMGAILLTCLHIFPVALNAQAPNVVVIETTGESAQLSPDIIGQIWRKRFGSAPAPTLPSNVVTTRLSESDFAMLNGRFNEARELFFNGSFQASLSAFQSLHDTLKKNLPSASHQAALRQLDRDTLLYIALVTGNISNGPDYQQHLRTAAVHYGDLALENSDFPPWLRDELAVIEQQQNDERIAAKITLPRDCHLLIDGLPPKSSADRLFISKGAHTFQTRCDNGAESLITRRHIGETGTVQPPAFVENFRLSLHNDVIVMSPVTQAPLLLSDAVSALRNLMQQLKMDQTMLLLRQKDAV
ncbi:MAG: hypothetical protein JXX14_20695, partial [Deltaproteobacteria bacterium]|nr:hypothetical protein [Deltaproteobacteria bacterium]